MGIYRVYDPYKWGGGYHGLVVDNLTNPEQQIGPSLIIEGPPIPLPPPIPPLPPPPPPA